MKEISPGIRIIGLALYIDAEDTLVFGDTHLGIEEELRSLGMLVPREQYRQIVEHLSGVFWRIGKNVHRIIINGDLKHEFGKISSQEWSEVLGFLDYLKGHCDEIALIKGNHDTILGPLAKRKDLELMDHLYLKNSGVYVCHGDKIPDDRDYGKAKTIIIGHEHPAVNITDGVRSERMKCFIKQGRLIAMPSLSYATEGSDMASEERLSPLMEDKKGDAVAYCIEGFDVYCFGKLKDL